MKEHRRENGEATWETAEHVETLESDQKFTPTSTAKPEQRATLRKIYTNEIIVFSEQQVAVAIEENKISKALEPVT